MEGKRLRIFGDIWKQMWPAALLLYISYFFYRWIGVYTAGILGETADILLYKSGEGMARGVFRDLAVAFLLALLLMPMVDFLTNVLLFRMGLRYEASVVDRVFRKDYEIFLAWQSDQWTGRISTDPLQYRQMAVVTPTRLLADITVLLVALAALFRIEAVLTVILMAGIGFSILLRLLCRKRDEYFHEKKRRFQDEIKARQTEMVRESAFWASYGCRQSLPEWMGTRFADFYREVRKPEAAMTAGVACVQKGANAAVFLFSLFYGLRQVEKGRMGAGDFISIYFIVTQVRAMAESIVANLQTMKGYGAQRERMETLMGGSERTRGQKVGQWEQLSFRKVSYIYPGTANGMPEQDFAIRRGEAVKLQGENGCGKTTLLRLLGGLFSGKNGEVWIDGHSMKQIDLAAWREQIGCVQQFPDIFPGTVRENIRIGNLNASKEQVDAVLEKLSLNELADRMLSGSRTELSGGEMKRIELARLLLREGQCSLLMLDEPFENLDEEGRKVVREIMEYSGKARILISHGKSEKGLS